MASNSKINITLIEKLKVLKETQFKTQLSVASESEISLGTVNKIIKRKREWEELGDQSYCSPCNSAFSAAINMESLVLDMIIRGGKHKIRPCLQNFFVKKS